MTFLPDSASATLSKTLASLSRLPHDHGDGHIHGVSHSLAGSGAILGGCVLLVGLALASWMARKSAPPR
jgi:hypothetical protein